MKKQILSISLAAALAVSCTGIAMAEDKTPTVFVNQGQIFFDDQAPVILGEGTTLVPARGVFEAMGAKVEWKEDTRTVDVSNCISISGTTFVIDTKEILHKKKIEVCISKRIGLKARFNNRWYKIIPISNSNNKSLKSNDSIEAIIQQFIYYNCLKNERLSA